MSVRVQLDRPHAHFTNLDFITGRVILYLQNDQTVTNIVVKLEGESKTRLSGPRSVYDNRPDRRNTELEIHKVLYKVREVFPSVELKRQTTSGYGYTLPPGQHEYPFQFKIPFNNDCSTRNSLGTNLSVTGFGMEMARDTNRHVKKTLPPSLSGFPGEAEIRYFVKVTVARPQIWKENHRAETDFRFFPIEPPRPLSTKQESYARRQHQFNDIAIGRKKSLFRKEVPDSPPRGETPRLSIDARLPNPAIVTCNEPLPLRIVIRKQSDFYGMVYLHMLQIELIGYTTIRAHELTRTESGSWVLASYSNLGEALVEAEALKDAEYKVDSKYWQSIPLPNTVAPSFDTCNISRAYELEVRSQFIALPLRLPIKVFSGIAPPQALLSAIAAAGSTANHNVQIVASTLPQYSSQGSPETVMAPAYSHMPPGPAGYTAIPSQGGDDAPPSYEDAMGDDIGPVDGRRRSYNDTGARQVAPAISGDQKSPNGFRNEEERLFPDRRPSDIPRTASTTVSIQTEGERLFPSSASTQNQVDMTTEHTEPGQAANVTADKAVPNAEREGAPPGI
ncbi:MAG: hypothetical protein M1827_001373 [Pycnora praestabilis]|nr:MAG: hypothetical protein M1827_001373 [Pycnora praestabilis]